MEIIKSISAKNHYETLIDNLMLQEVAGHNPELYNILLNADPTKRRYGILSTLDKDRNMFLSIKNIIKKNAVSKTEHIKDVVRMLRDYVKVGEVEKKKFGEVMTPISLVNEMLDTLPVEVWSNPDLKWLDPANGCGVFPSVVVERLMVGLESWQPNEELRYKHIMENMIYVCELQPKNMFLFLCAFDPNDEYELNVYTGSFLDAGFDEHMKNVWGIDKFDVVVGNVPYQDGTVNGGQNKIYNFFCKKSLNLNVEKILYVTPISLLKNSKRFSIVNLLGVKKVCFTNKYFKGIGVQTCYWYYEKNYRGKIDVVNNDGSIVTYNSGEEIYDIGDNNADFILLKNSIIEYTKNKKNRMFSQNPVDAKNGRSKEYSDVYCYPVYKIGKTESILSQYNKPLPKFHNSYKIVVSITKALNNNAIVATKNDYDVNHVFTEINNEQQYKNIKNFLLSKTFLNISDMWKRSDGYGFNIAIKLCPKFDKDTDWNDEKVKNFFNNFTNKFAT